MNYKNFKKQIETKDKIFDFFEEAKSELCEAVTEVSESVEAGTKKLGNKLTIQKIHFEIFSKVLKAENKLIYLVNDSKISDAIVEKCFINETEINLSDILFTSAIAKKINVPNKEDNNIVWNAIDCEDTELEKEFLAVTLMLSNNETIDCPCFLLKDD